MTKQTYQATTASANAVEARQYVKAEDRVFFGADQPTLHHVSLFVSDLEASVRFYTTGLGLTLRETFDDIMGLPAFGAFRFKVESLFLEAGQGHYVELHPVDGAEMSAPGFPLNHLALAVADVDAAYSRALATGGSPFGFTLQEERWDGSPLDVIMSGKRSEPIRMAFLQGPSNELVELYQAAATYTAPAKEEV